MSYDAARFRLIDRGLLRHGTDPRTAQMQPDYWRARQVAPGAAPAPAGSLPPAPAAAALELSDLPAQPSRRTA